MMLDCSRGMCWQFVARDVTGFLLVSHHRLLQFQCYRCGPGVTVETIDNGDGAAI